MHSPSPLNDCIVPHSDNAMRILTISGANSAVSENSCDRGDLLRRQKEKASPGKDSKTEQIVWQTSYIVAIKLSLMVLTV